MRRQICDRLPYIARDQTEDRASGGSEILDVQFEIEEDRRDLRAVKQVLQVAVGVVDSATLRLSSALTVSSSSLKDCSSSFEVSSSSFVD